MKHIARDFAIIVCKSQTRKPTCHVDVIYMPLCCLLLSGILSTESETSAFTEKSLKKDLKKSLMKRRFLMFNLYRKVVTPVFAAAALGLLILVMAACGIDPKKTAERQTWVDRRRRLRW
jgi:hypothetical protein